VGGKVVKVEGIEQECGRELGERTPLGGTDVAEELHQNHHDHYGTIHGTTLVQSSYCCLITEALLLIYIHEGKNVKIAFVVC
jgi:hypothetical protein